MLQLPLHSLLPLCMRYVIQHVLQPTQLSTESNTSNDPKCQELEWVCVPLAVESHGNWGKEVITSILPISLHRPKAKVNLINRQCIFRVEEVFSVFNSYCSEKKKVGGNTSMYIHNHSYMYIG